MAKVPVNIPEKYIARIDRIIRGSTEVFEITKAASAAAQQA